MPAPRKWKSSTIVYSIPASVMSPANVCSQTRSGTHMPRIVCAEQLFEVARVGADLPDAVAARNARQDRLVERPAEDLDLPALDELAEPVDVLGVMLDEPFQQAAGGVQRDRELRVVAEDVQERAVAVLVRRFEDPVEIADRLVVVQGENQSNRRIHAKPPQVGDAPPEVAQGVRHSRFAKPTKDRLPFSACPAVPIHPTNARSSLPSVNSTLDLPLSGLSATTAIRIAAAGDR